MDSSQVYLCVIPEHQCDFPGHPINRKEVSLQLTVA